MATIDNYAYNNKPIIRTLRLHGGDDFYISFSHPYGTSGNITKARFVAQNIPGTGNLLDVEETSFSQFDFPSSNVGVFTAPGSATDGMPGGEYLFDIELTGTPQSGDFSLVSGTVLTVLTGRLILARDVASDLETSLLTPQAQALWDAIDLLEAGGIIASRGILKGWTESGAYEQTSTTFDSDGVVSSATVKWPDGSAGVFTRTTKNSTWLAIDAYTISHTDSGQTVTQSTVTRDSNGNVTVKPALTVA